GVIRLAFLAFVTGNARCTEWPPVKRMERSVARGRPIHRAPVDGGLMNRVGGISGVVLIALAAGVGCSSQADDSGAAAGALSAPAAVTGALDVDDVSILFANDAHGEPIPNIAVGDDLWPRAVFDEVTAFATTASINLHPEAKSRENWRVMGM